MKKLQIRLFQTLLLSSTLPLIIVGFITLLFLGKMAINDAEQRVKNAIKFESYTYQSVSENLKYLVSNQNRRIYSLLADEQIDLLKNEFQKVVAKNNLDFFVITDYFGKVLVSMSSPEFEGGDYSRDFFVRKALRGQVFVSTEVLDKKELEKLSLLEKAKIPGIEPVEALVLKVSMPVINNNEVIVGTMTAGYLLNNCNAAVNDKFLKDTEFFSMIFLGDVLVCSDVSLKKHTLGIGNKLNQEIIREIQEKKKSSLARIKIRGQWYLSGYTPLYNSQGEIVGILGTGLPEKAIFALRDQLMKIFVLAVVLSVILAFVIGLVIGEIFIGSIDKLYRGIEAFGRGDFSHRLEINTGDEIQELAEFFNKTMSQLLADRQKLEVCSQNIQNLETKVSQSTEQLETTQKQLVKCERMAAMGRMATSLSHELRNIFAEIQTCLYSLRSKMMKECPKFVDTLKGIDESLNHANEALSDILKFSYPKKMIFSEVDINYLMGDIIALPNIQDLIKNNKIQVEKKLASGLRRIKADGIQLREAIMNLVVNAIQAMPNGGKLGLVTEAQNSLALIKVADTGKGISQEMQANLFTPFFTTKSSGLGLGLCITQAVIQEHGGSIQVSSEVGKGTTFIITLPFNR